MEPSFQPVLDTSIEFHDAAFPLRSAVEVLELFRGSIARTGDLDATVRTQGEYGFSVVGRERGGLVPLAEELSCYGAELMLFPERSYGGWAWWSRRRR